LADVREPECTVPIHSERDIVLARQKGRALACELGFSVGNATLIATTISELARNIVSYAGKGEIAMSQVRVSDRTGITIVASDSGPGIADLTLALREGFSTSGGLGLGLPGTRRLMDEFDIDSQPGRGTIITVTKWKS
jgi:serine/threonine-protein kinase RsbT